jgi:hypothetical protein
MFLPLMSFFSMLLSSIVDMDVFSNKIEESKHERDILCTIILASFGSEKNGKQAEG